MKIKTREERKQWLEEKRKKKEENNVLSLKNKRKNEYLSKEIIKKKIQNSQIFSNVNEITDSGLIKLKTNQVALFYKVSPIDLSLTNENEQKLFFIHCQNYIDYHLQLKHINLMKKLILILIKKITKI